MSANKYNQVKESRGTIFLNNLIGGIAWAIGASIGASLLLAIVGFILGHFNTVPVIGNYILEINHYLSQKN